MRKMTLLLFLFTITIVANAQVHLVQENFQDWRAEAGSEMMNAKTTGRLDTSLQKGLYLVRFVGIDGKTASGKVALD